MRKLLILLICVPFVSLAQIDTTKSFVVVNSPQQNIEALNDNMKRAGMMLEQASNNYFAAIGFVVAGAITAASGAYNGEYEMVYVGAGISGASIVCSVISWYKIRKAGKALQGAN